MKTIFWNVDTQYDFMRTEGDYVGKLGIPEAQGIESKLEELTTLAEEKRVRVVNTADWHTPESEELSNEPDFANTFPPHCLENTYGAEFVPATSPNGCYRVDWRDAELDEKRVLEERNLVLYKDKFDVFAGTPHADRVVDLINPDRAVVYGVASNVCVDFAVRGLVKKGVEVYVPVDAVKGLPNLPSPLDDWRNLPGVRLGTAEGVRNYLEGSQ